MEEYNEVPQPVEEYQEEVIMEEKPTNPAGKFSFIWGIISCVVSIVVLGLIIFSIAEYRMCHELAWVCMGLSAAFFVFSIITLIFGIKGIRKNPRTKAIIGTAFSAQNIFVFAYFIFLCLIPIGMHESYSSTSDFDLDDLYDTPMYEEVEVATEDVPATADEALQQALDNVQSDYDEAEEAIEDIDW